MDRSPRGRITELRACAWPISSERKLGGTTAPRRTLSKRKQSPCVYREGRRAIADWSSARCIYTVYGAAFVCVSLRSWIRERIREFVTRVAAGDGVFDSSELKLSCRIYREIYSNDRNAMIKRLLKIRSL